MSRTRSRTSAQIASGKNPFESINVSSMAKCSSSAILPFILAPRMPSHHAMAWRDLSAIACAAKSRLEGGFVLPNLLAEGREGWWSQGESNPRPRECHSRALPTELWPQFATSSAALRIRRKDSTLFFFLDRLADDVGHVGVAFFLLLNEGRIVEALVAHLDFLFFACCRCLGGSRLLALLF